MRFRSKHSLHLRIDMCHRKIFKWSGEILRRVMKFTKLAIFTKQNKKNEIDLLVH